MIRDELLKIIRQDFVGTRKDTVKRYLSYFVEKGLLTEEDFEKLKAEGVLT